MYDAQMAEQDRSVLRWGGLAGIAGSLLLVTTFGIVATLIGAEDAGAAGKQAIIRFPDIRPARHDDRLQPGGGLADLRPVPGSPHCDHQRSHAQQVEEHIERNEQAAEECRRIAAQRQALLG